MNFPHICAFWLAAACCAVSLSACGPGAAAHNEADEDVMAADADAATSDVAVADTGSPDVAKPDVAQPDVAAIDVPVGCTNDSACAVPGPCVSGTCKFSNTTDACDDGNACTSGDTCKSGACHGAAIVNCDDGVACTTDSCDLATGCTHSDASGPCTDGDACTSGDTCALGLCTGTTTSCDDGNGCTADACDSALGCSHSDTANPCDDGNVCTSNDKCVGTACAGSGVVCDDGDPCTADGCNPAGGCFSVPSPGAPGCQAISCDASTLSLTDLKPICPDTACPSPVCEPVDPATCYVSGTTYKCAAPKCACGDTKVGTCTLPPPQITCDPVCEPPSCGIQCPNNQCGNESCPQCESTCGATKCQAKCNKVVGDGACGPVFGCHIDTPTCTTTCTPVTCYWENLDDPANAPVCGLPPATTGLELPNIHGSQCLADGSVVAKAWNIVCQQPECEIKCASGVNASCPGEANCAIDCANPVCNVACDPPACVVDPAKGIKVCQPATNCVTTCSCAVGVCTSKL